jgi:TRAP-type transport system periplasmic protein
MRKFCVSAVWKIIAPFLFLSLALVGAKAAPVKWDLPSVYPPGNMQVTSFEEFAKRVAAATNGEVLITVHPGGSLGLKGPEMVSAIRDGIVPIGDITPQQAIGDIPLGGFAALPGLTSGFKETRMLLDIARPYYAAALAKNNQKLLFATVWPGQGIYAKQPVKVKADLKGIKIRTSDKNSTDFFKSLGAAPIMMPWGEVVPALISGAIGSVTTSTQSGVDGKFWEFLKHFNRTSWANPIEVVSVNLDAWNKLTPAQRAAIEKIAVEIEPELWVRTEKLDGELAALIQKNGITITEPSDEFKKDLAAAASPIWTAWAKSAGPDAEKILAEFRAKVGR